jgi:type I restriction enzyme R subunit
MSFNEQNSVEHFIIRQLSGVNLNGSYSVEEPVTPYGLQWQYLPASSLLREQTEILVENKLKQALIRIHPEIATQHDRADRVIYKLRTILLSVGSNGSERFDEQQKQKQSQTN